MYNVDFLPQLEKARRHLFGNSGQPPGPDTVARFVSSAEVVPCHQDENGEWVPDVDIFETETS